jgi:hypothetical protein
VISKGGRDVLKKSVLLLPVVLASAFAGAQVLGQASGSPDSDLQNAFSRSSLTCSEPGKIVVPLQLADRARLKVRLVNLLRLSLFDDAKGIVNIEREKEIKQLASKLKKSSP